MIAAVQSILGPQMGMVTREEMARLREALEKIVRVPLWDEYICIEIARAALEKEKK
jgi:hypothetical protein